MVLLIKKALIIMKHSLRCLRWFIKIIIALVAHFDLEVHQMDVKTTFLNGDLKDEVYMTQPKGFINNN